MIQGNFNQNLTLLNLTETSRAIGHPNQKYVKKEEIEDLINYLADFLNKGGNPNQRMSFLKIYFENGICDFQNPTIFHIVCFIKHNVKLMQDAKIEPWLSLKNYNLLDILIEQMLSDRRLDVHAKFSEGVTDTGGMHFNLEETTIAHYYTAKGDIETFNKIIRLAPELINMASTFVKFSENVPPKRISGITPLHIAARAGDATMCSFLFGKSVNTSALDSNSHRPIDYLEQAIQTQSMQDVKIINLLRSLLQPRPNPTSYLPQTNMTFTRNGYTAVYNPSTKTPIYVYQRLTPNTLEKNVKRERNTHIEKEVPALNRAKNKHFEKKGLDKAHMASAKDASYCPAAMYDFFSLINIAPQNPTLNRGYWKKIENQTRQWAQFYELLEVYTGPLFLADHHPNGKKIVAYEVIGEGNVAVPTHFFKVFFAYKGLNIQKRALYVPNAPIHKDTPIVWKSVDEIQILSGILFNTSR